MKRKTLAVSLSAILAASMLLDAEAIPKVGIQRVLLTMVVPAPAQLMHPTQAQMLLVQVSSTMETM